MLRIIGYLVGYLIIGTLVTFAQAMISTLNAKAFDREVVNSVDDEDVCLQAVREFTNNLDERTNDKGMFILVGISVLIWPINFAMWAIAEPVRFIKYWKASRNAKDS